jgi:hypothetical protein
MTTNASPPLLNIDAVTNIKVNFELNPTIPILTMYSVDKIIKYSEILFTVGNIFKNIHIRNDTNNFNVTFNDNDNSGRINKINETNHKIINSIANNNDDNIQMLLNEYICLVTKSDNNECECVFAKNTNDSTYWKLQSDEQIYNKFIENIINNMKSIIVGKELDHINKEIYNHIREHVSRKIATSNIIINKDAPYKIEKKDIFDIYREYLKDPLNFTPIVAQLHNQQKNKTYIHNKFVLCVGYDIDVCCNKIKTSICILPQNHNKKE